MPREPIIERENSAVHTLHLHSIRRYEAVKHSDVTETAIADEESLTDRT